MSFMRRDHTTAGSPKFPPTCVDAHRRRASRGHVESSSECSSDYGLRAPSRGGQSVRDQLQRLLEQALTRPTKYEEPRRQRREAKKADKQTPAHSRAFGWNPCSLAKGVSSPLWKVRSLHNPKKWDWSWNLRRDAVTHDPEMPYHSPSPDSQISSLLVLLFTILNHAS